MKLSSLLAIPVGGGILVFALGALLGGSEPLWYGTQVASQVAGVAGCLAAAAALGRQDFMLRAWLLTAASLAIQLGWRLAIGPSTASWGPLSVPDWVGTLVLVTLNAAAIAGSLLFVLAFVRAGLVLPGLGRRIALDAAVCAVIAAVLAVPTATRMFREATTPTASFEAAVIIVSDVVCLFLVAPLWRISRAFSGGVLAWPWAFLAFANLGYLLNDAAQVLGGVSGPGAAASPGRWVAEGLFAASAGAIAAAGLAHRRALTMRSPARTG